MHHQTTSKRRSSACLTGSRVASQKFRCTTSLLVSELDQTFKVNILFIACSLVDWNDGKAIGALVDNVAPGLCPDWATWDPKDALQNAAEAMGLADDWLGVRQLIKPDEMTNPNIDEQSMMTYLSQYPAAKLKQGAPIRPRTNPNR